jgi:hypothetical protein
MIGSPSPGLSLPGVNVIRRIFFATEGMSQAKVFDPDKFIFQASLTFVGYLTCKYHIPIEKLVSNL